MEEPIIVNIEDRCKFSIMFGTNCVLIWHGLTMVLGDVRALRYDISPMPHAWRVKFYNDQESDNGPWFDTSEEAAIQIENAIEKALS
jgi:hypothetical protein